MKKGQIGIGLVILGVVAIIAVIGLVLLFTRASKVEGALLTDLSIGSSYGTETMPGLGISEVYTTPEYIRYQGGGGAPMQPEVAYPTANYYQNYQTYPSVNTQGTRTPAFIVSAKYAEGARSGFATLEDMYGCEYDLIRIGIGVPHDLYNAYSVPNKAGTSQATGLYPPSSSAEPRPTKDYIGKIGGDMYMYMNSVGAEQTMQGKSSEDLNRELILTKLVYGNVGTAKYEWTSVMMNGKEVPVCWVSAKTFPFPQ